MIYYILMKEFIDDNSSDPIRDIAHSVAELGIGLIRQRDYMGRKVAQEFMDEIGLSGSLDETGDTALADLLGVAVTGGIVLGMKHKTDIVSIQEEIDRLYNDLPDPLQLSVGRLIPYLVPRGIAFYNDDLRQNTPKVQSWVSEFQLLTSSDTY
jgi:hypothetical protein